MKSRSIALKLLMVNFVLNMADVHFDTRLSQPKAVQISKVVV